MKYRIIFNFFIILCLVLVNFECNSIEPQINEPEFVVDETNFSASLVSYGNNDFRVRVYYKITYHFLGQPGYFSELSFLTNGFTFSINYAQSSSCKIGIKYQKDSGFWLPDSLTYLDSLKLLFLVDGSFENILNDSIVYNNFTYSDSVNIIVQKN